MSADTTIAILQTLIAGIAAAVIVYWHIATRGAWSHWPAGRSLMALLGIITVGHAWRGVNRLVGAEYVSKDPVSVVLYAVFAMTLVLVGLTIRKELRVGKARVVVADDTVDPSDLQTGMVAVVLTTNTKESPNESR